MSLYFSLFYSAVSGNLSRVSPCVYLITAARAAGLDQCDFRWCRFALLEKFSVLSWLTVSTLRTNGRFPWVANTKNESKTNKMLMLAHQHLRSSQPDFITANLQLSGWGVQGCGCSGRCSEPLHLCSKSKPSVEFHCQQLHHTDVTFQISLPPCRSVLLQLTPTSQRSHGGSQRSHSWTHSGSVAHNGP